MSNAVKLKSSYKLANSIETIYTGGSVQINLPTNRLFTTVGEEILISDLSTGQKIQTLEGDTEDVTCFAVNPQGTYLVSASRSLQIKIWDLSTFKVLNTIRLKDTPIIVMTIDQSGTLVALGSADSTIQIYHITKGYCTHNFKRHGGVVSALKFFTPPKTKDLNQIWLASGANDCKVILWDLKSSNHLATFTHHGSVIRGLDFSEDGQLLLAGSRDKTVSLWNTKTLKLIKSVALYESIEEAGFIKSSENLDITNEKPTQFFTGGESGLIKIWDLESGEEIITQVQEGATSHQITQTLYLRDTQQLVAVTDDHNIIFYSVEDNLSRVKQIVGYNEEIIDLKLLEYTYNNEEHSHLLVASNSEQLKVIDLSTSCTDLLFGHSDIVVSLATNPSGTVFASGSKDNSARIWRANVGDQLSFECLAECVGHNEAVGAIALSKKSNGPQYLLTGSEDLTVKLWEYTDYVESSMDDNEIPQLQSKYTFRAHDKAINCISFAPNDKVFATASQDKTIKVWNTADGTLLGTCTGHKRGVWSVEFSPVEQIMVTSSGDKTVKIWSLKDFSCLKTFEGHTNTVLRASFLSSGLQIVSCGADGLVKLWTIKNNECVATLDGHTEKIWSLTCSKDEQFLVTGGADSVINLWEDTTESEQQAKREEEEAKIIQNQELSNYMVQKDYKNAIKLAIRLNHPFQLLNILYKVLENSYSHESITGSIEIDEIFSKLNNEHLQQILKYICDWNTNFKHSPIAQNLLHIIFKSYHPSTLNELNGIQEVFKSLIPYTERHYNKLDDQITQTYLLDYTLAQMDLI